MENEKLESRLQELKKMLEQNTITQEEYNALRKRAIDGAK
jgi:membrane peptidoglycan carboxypeptidase